MPDNICDVSGVLVGHATDLNGLTGCTAVLFESPAVVGVDVRGSSPETRGTEGLGPTGVLRDRHGLVLTGGSAFGLASVDGVIQYLEECGVGLDVGVARIPLVSGAVIFDLMVGDPNARPGQEMGYRAAESAESGDFEQGAVGAGTGATVGNVLGMERCMKGGIGSASVRLENGLIVGALAAVNAFGDVRDEETGEIVAGPRLDDGSLGDSVELLSEAARLRWGENTTLGIVATNARLDRSSVTKVAQMAHDGFARAIHPAHGTLDGDVAFAASVGNLEVATDIVGAWAARAMREAILRGVRSARSVPGIPGLAGDG